MAGKSDKRFKVISMGTRCKDPKGSNFHSHDYTEFIYFSDGNGTFVCGGEEFAFKPNTLICVPPGVSHTEFTDTLISNVYFLTDADCFSGNKARIYEDHIMREMECLTTQLRYHYYRRAGNYRDVCSAIISLMIELVNSKKPVDETEAFVDQAVSVIVANMTDPEFDLNRIYDDIPLSKVYFASLFKKVTGMAPLEYLNFMRVENAKTLLLSRSVTNNSICEIAGFSGFEDAAYFSRLFKKYTGLSPLNWQKSHEEPGVPESE